MTMLHTDIIRNGNRDVTNNWIIGQTSASDTKLLDHTARTARTYNHFISLKCGVTGLLPAIANKKVVLEEPAVMDNDENEYIYSYA